MVDWHCCSITSIPEPTFWEQTAVAIFSSCNTCLSVKWLALWQGWSQHLAVTLEMLVSFMYGEGATAEESVILETNHLSAMSTLAA